MHRLSLVINSHETSEDVWEAFFGELIKYEWTKAFASVYLFSSRPPIKPIPFYYQSGVELIVYNKELPYSLQYLSCIKKVPEEYVVIVNEDCIPFGPILFNEVNRILDLMVSAQLDVDFVKCVRGTESVIATSFDNVYYINQESDMIFTQQVSIWKTRSLLNVYAHSPVSFIARKGGIQQEQVATQVCRELGIKGALYYQGERKRGMYHYDSEIFPHICTAIVGGKWNVAEYSSEVLELSKTYNIDLASRGFYEG